MSQPSHIGVTLDDQGKHAVGIAGPRLPEEQLGNKDTEAGGTATE